jgi:hypothetical protein
VYTLERVLEPGVARSVGPSQPTSSFSHLQSHRDGDRAGHEYHIAAIVADASTPGCTRATIDVITLVSLPPSIIPLVWAMALGTK